VTLVDLKLASSGLLNQLSGRIGGLEKNRNSLFLRAILRN